MHCAKLSKDKKVVFCTMEEWAQLYEGNQSDRIVAKESFDTDHGPVDVSTVFLGLDHSFRYAPEEGIWFETMIFGLPPTESEYQTRCSTYEQAEKMHQEAVGYLHTISKRVTKVRSREKLARHSEVLKFMEELRRL